MTVPEGPHIAFDAAPLDSSPTYTRLDQIDGLGFPTIQIDRGRPTERDKTDIGRMTIHAIDTKGILDPTNTGGTFFGKLDPVKPVGYGLRNPVTTTVSPLFEGFVSDYNHDLTGLDRRAVADQVEIVCTDALEIISDAEIIPDQAGNTVPGESTGNVYYDPVTVTSDRIRAAIQDSAVDFGNPFQTDWPASQVELYSGNVKLKAGIYSSQTPLIQVIDDAADGEFPGVANRYVSKGGTIIFHGRFARFYPAVPQYHITTWKVGDGPAFAADSTRAVISDLQFSRGKTNLINAGIATPKGIADANIAGQFVSDATSIAKYGARSISFPNLLTDGHSDGSTTDLQETKLFPTYYVDNYKNPRSRVNQIVFRSQDPTGPYGPNIWALLCGIELSDIVSLKTTHPGGGGFNEDFYVEGIHYLIQPANQAYPDVTLTLDLSPKAYYDTDPFARTRLETAVVHGVSTVTATLIKV